jgi:hypothetical protein
MRWWYVFIWPVLSIAPAPAQTIDSLHIFRSIPVAVYSTSLAETMGWRLQRERAPFVSIGADQIKDLNDDLLARKPVKHAHRYLPGLSHLGFVYYDKRAHVFCLSTEEGLIVDLTARRQFRLEDWTDRAKMKAVLLALGL